MNNNKVCFISSFDLEVFFKPIFIKESDYFDIVSFIRIENVKDINEKFDLIVFIIDYNVIFEKLIEDYTQEMISKKKFTTLIKDFFNNIILDIQNDDTIILFNSFYDLFDKNSLLFGNLVINDYDNIINDLIYKNYYLLNINKIFEKLGFNNYYSIKRMTRWEIPFTDEFFTLLSNDINTIIHNEFLKTKKCIVLDCDNVLWGGILSEDGINKISIERYNNNRIFYLFQKLLKYILIKGIILTIASKNNYDDVIEVFDKNPNMILKKNDISIFEVNWGEKYKSIINISKKLNIGLDSIIFIDDSIFEINSIKKILPSVKSILFTPDTILNKLKGLNLKRYIDYKEVINRKKTYKTDIYRNELKVNSKSYDEFLKKLEIRVIIKTSNINELVRIYELNSKTNKFNNGIRLNKKEIIEKIKNKSIYSVYVRDIYSNLGLVGSFSINETSIINFCLSCRALGRRIENSIINFIKEKNIVSCFFIYLKENYALCNLLKDNNIDIIKKI